MPRQAVPLLLWRLTGAGDALFLSFRVHLHLPALAEARFETLTTIGQCQCWSVMEQSLPRGFKFIYSVWPHWVEPEVCVPRTQ